MPRKMVDLLANGVVSMKTFRDLLTSCKNKGPYVLVGDFNARLQGKLLGEDAMLGPFMYGRGVNFVGDDTDNRALLMDFCDANNHMVGNTWFEHPAGRQVTYHAPGVDHLPSTNDVWDPVQFAQLDLCLVPMRWRNACLNIFSQPRANLDSDHFPVMISLRVKLGATSTIRTMPTWDFSAATADQLAAMNRDIADQVNRVGGGVDCAQRWESLHRLYVTAITAHIPRKYHRPRKPWIRERTLDPIRQRGAARALGDLA